VTGDAGLYPLHHDFLRGWRWFSAACAARERHPEQDGSRQRFRRGFHPD